MQYNTKVSCGFFGSVATNLSIINHFHISKMSRGKNEDIGVNSVPMDPNDGHFSVVVSYKTELQIQHGLISAFHFRK